MKKSVKVSIYLFFIVSFLALAFYYFNQNNSILGNVISFSQKQESSGNVFSILVTSFVVLSIVVIFTFFNILNNIYDKKKAREEVDAILGKK